MPALPTWYSRLPEILTTLGAAPPFLDRPAFEEIFHLRRRQAIRLMASAGGYQVGRTFLVERDGLVRFLRQIHQSPEARHAVQRKVRILGVLQQQQRVAVPTTPPASTSSPSLTPGVQKTAPGILEIRYTGITDLLSKIATLAALAAEDFPRFRQSFE